MKAVVWHDAGKTSVDEVADPVLRDPAGPDPTAVISQRASIPTAVEAFDRREPGWTKATLELTG